MNQTSNPLINILVSTIILLCISCRPADNPVRIDRRALVTRHIPVNTSIDSLSPFSVGNGEFAFTADITDCKLPENTKPAFPEPWPNGAGTFPKSTLYFNQTYDIIRPTEKRSHMHHSKTHLPDSGCAPTHTARTLPHRF
jgi:hypothetical protein